MAETTEASYREIEFRGKHIVKGWLFGSLLTSSTGRRIQVQSPKEKPDDLDVVKSYIVDPTTLGQFSGIRDKNNKKVFENDFVHVRGSKRVGVYTTRIVFINGRFDLKVNKTILKNGFVPFLIEVVGNIHDNEDLFLCEINE